MRPNLPRMPPLPPQAQRPQQQTANPSDRMPSTFAFQTIVANNKKLQATGGMCLPPQMIADYTATGKNPRGMDLDFVPQMSYHFLDIGREGDSWYEDGGKNHHWTPLSEDMINQISTCEFPIDENPFAPYRF